jgi:Brp/Blh family beta-carotene 15,15'-monooxygenase
MSQGAKSVYNGVRSFSSSAVAAGLLIALVLSAAGTSKNLTWQVLLALVAIAAGIPHGAVDHLIAIGSKSKIKLAIIVFCYVLVAVLAVLAILKWNVVGFRLVLIMSALHFGIGDTAYIADLNRLNSKKAMSRVQKLIFALAIGAVPVLIPLTKKESTSALGKVNPELVNWAGSLTNTIYRTTLGLALFAGLLLLISRRYRDLLDLALLTSLALFAPPLVAFAIYFGCWHAMRHTARLTLLLPRSIAAANKNEPGKSFLFAVLPGLPALLLTLVTAVIITIAKGSALSADYLWYLLVVVWALTVPHMLVTARIDKRTLKN